MSGPFYDDAAVTIHHGNALALPLEDASVDLVVTSPPYFGLRSYQDGGEHYGGQIGSEATPAEFVDALIAATAEMVRVLKPSGSIWVNLGDKYAGAPSVPRSGMPDGATRRAEAHIFQTRTRRALDVPTKSLIGIPWRYALRCIDDLGLILRAEVIWSKPNGLPESVTDRVRRSHETWFHFTVRPRYFSAVDEVREPHLSVVTPGRRHEGAAFGAIKNGGGDGSRHTDGHPLGKLPGSVWDIPTQPLRVPDHLGIDHFAAFPMEWPRRIIRGWSPSGVCVECGEGRRPVLSDPPKSSSWTDHSQDDHAGRSSNGSARNKAYREKLKQGAGAAIAGEQCACLESTAPTRPAVVLDPFGGTGTTALVARSLGRRAVHVDLSADYCRLAQWRVTDPGELARALQVDKPEPVAEGQDDLLALLDGEPA